MIANRKKHSRESGHTTFYSFIYYIFPPFLGKLTLLSMLPAFLYSCTEATEIHTMAYDETAEMRSMDIFVFRDDKLQRLDCYQRFDDMSLWNGTVVSGSGERILSAIVNSPYKREDWYSLTSRSKLRDIILNLEEERREYPFLSGEKRLTTVNYRLSDSKELGLKPFTSEIRLKSICCDFRGKAYEGKKLTDVKVYLTNVNSECRIIEDEEAPPRRIINSGGLNEDDVSKFSQPDLIVQEIEGEIGVRAFFPDIRLRCYQNNHPEETLGTPYTRLVIEGKISGQTYYWPITINRDTDEEPGIWRNRQYSYNLKITRKGSTDPETPVKPEDIIINQEIAEWKETAGYTVSF